MLSVLTHKVKALVTFRTKLRPFSQNWRILFIRCFSVKSNTSVSNYCSLMEYWPDKLIPFPLLFQWPVQTGLDFPIVAPSSSSWSLYTTITSTTTVLEKSQLLKGFQVEQKYSRLPTQLHVSPLTPHVPLNIPSPPWTYCTHSPSTSLITTYFYRYLSVYLYHRCFL